MRSTLEVSADLSFVKGSGYKGKEVFNMIGATVLILVTLPLMLGAGIAVRITSPGPVLFRQQREGAGGEIFTALKFRTLHVGTEKELDVVTADDSRQTRVGRFLRKTCIDELPQFFNVLRGEMDLVGHRPDTPAIAAKRLALDPRYAIIGQRKPGMAGLVVLIGKREELEIANPAFNAMDLELKYLEEESFFLDLKIFALTLWKVFRAIVRSIVHAVFVKQQRPQAV